MYNLRKDRELLEMAVYMYNMRNMAVGMCNISNMAVNM